MYSEISRHFTEPESLLPCSQDFYTGSYPEPEQNSVHTSEETHYVSTTEPSLLMLFGKAFVIYCENRTKFRDTLCGQNVVRTSQETLRVRYRAQPVNAVRGN
jgi:hypothetical protein